MENIRICGYLTGITILFIVQSCGKKTESEYWRFINAPDLHNSEVFVRVWESEWKDNFDSYEVFREHEIKRQREKFRYVHEKHQAELFVSPGDCNSARWDSRWGTGFRKNFRSVPKYAELSNEEIILEALRLCYTALNEMVYSSGFKEFLMTVGDHEIGDNPWPLGSETPTSLPYFRQGFANHFTLKTPGGESRFIKLIGNAPPRPIGTIYENTSNAVQYKNVLFISLDVFRYDGENVVLGDQGLICGDISGKHFEWLVNVLEEAQVIPSIKHIVVQAHLPIIYPVRKYASSGMLMSGTSDNILLKTMRKYNVDFYLAGEVHMNTVTKDPESDLIQFVGRGNNLSNYTVIKVENSKLTITSYKNDDAVLGELVIDKSKSEKTVKGSGMLEPINPKGLQVHWSFDERTTGKDFSCSLGTFSEMNGFKIVNSPIDKVSVHENLGQFGKSYSLFGENIELADGIIGNAIVLNQDSKLYAVSIGPMYADFERTISGWIKTSVGGRRLILNSNSRWRDWGQFFNLSMNDGCVELSLRPEITAKGNEPKINDNQWHHFAVVVPKRNAALIDCIMYVDGKMVQDISYENGNEKINTIQSNWMTIATQSEQFKTDLKKTMNMSDFTGLIDEFCIWTRALNSQEIKFIYENGCIGINVMSAEKTQNL